MSVTSAALVIPEGLLHRHTLLANIIYRGAKRQNNVTSLERFISAKRALGHMTSLGQASGPIELLKMK